MNRLLRFLAAFILLSNGLLLAQQSKIDSINNLISTKSYKNDDEHLKLISNLCELYIAQDLSKAKQIALSQIELSKDLKNLQYEADGEESLGRIFYLQGRNDSAVICFNRSMSIQQGPDAERRIIETKNYLANVYKNTAQYDKGMELYNQVLKFYEVNKDEVMIGQTLANIGALYYSAGNQDKATEYTLQALEMQRKTGDQKGSMVSLINLMVFALNKQQFDKGIEYGDEALKLLKTYNRPYYAAALTCIGFCYFMKGNREKAIKYTEEAIQINKENNSISGMMEGYRSLANYHLEMKQYKKAKQYGLDALAIADTSNRLDLRLIYDVLKMASIYLNEPEEAIEYSGKQLKMKEEDLNKEWAEKIANADAQYQTEKKENQIKQLVSEKKIRTTILISLAGLLLLGSLTAFFLFKSLKQKKTLAEQKVIQLEQERQLTATRALLEGETNERVRISKDLHDGLGGMLSVVKLKIINMKGNLTIPEENVDAFNTALDMLDSSIKELRRVAHNLMPETLMKFGINPAISDFCRSIDNANYHFYGTERRLDEKLEIAVYRIVHELVNNAIKHSNAEQINVQLILDTDRVSIVVQDNGKGFDPNSPEKKEGRGLQNIKSRVDSFNGQIVIYSAPGKGTEITVEFKG